MAMFGAPRATSMFAQPGYGAPQGAPQITQSAPQYQPFAPAGGIAPDYKPGMSEKLAAIGGILSQLGGVQNDAFSQYQQNIQQHRLMQQRAQAEAAKMYQPQDVGGSLVRLNPQTGKYEAVYTPEPKPVNNDTANDYEYIKAHLGQNAADGYLRNMAAGPPMAVENPDGTRTIYPRGAFGGAPDAPKPAPPGVTFTPLDGPAPLTPTAAAPILRRAAGSTTISRGQAAQIRASLGPNGQAAFGQWLKAHNVTIGDQ